MTANPQLMSTSISSASSEISATSDASHIVFVDLNGEVLKSVSSRETCRAAIESFAAAPFTVYVLPTPISLATQALLRDELIRRTAAAPWAIEGIAPETDLESWKKQQRQKFAACWPAPTEVRPERLIQIGSIAPLAATGLAHDVPNERIFAGRLMAERCVEQLDYARTEMRRLLWQGDADIGARRQQALTAHGALYNAFVVSADWPGDKPLADGCYQRLPVKQTNGVLFGQPVTLNDAKENWTTLRERILSALAADVHATLSNAAFTAAADSRALPRVLILGESGTGKSLVVEYLARRVSESGLRRLQRVAVPDYVGAESNLKHELFGYAPGSFTGASPRGEAGLLLSNVGGVIFLDEIGDASPELQAKLLAYLDDYRVRPVGYSGAPFACPTLVVAATNRPVERWAQAHREGKSAAESGHWFRHDLLERFDLVVHLPTLNERINAGDLPAIVDTLLQTEAVNPMINSAATSPQRRVVAIDNAAIDALAKLDYTGANLRMLTRLLTAAVQHAARSARDFVAASDLPPNETAPPAQ